MKYRIIDNPTSTAYLFIIQVKFFLFWHFVDGCMTIEEGKKIIERKPPRYRISNYFKSRVKYEVKL